MELLSGAVSLVSSAVSAVCSGISSVCSAIGGALFSGASGVASLAASIMGPLTPTIGEILVAIHMVSTIVSYIAEALGLKGQEEKPEELALKAEEADRKPEDFDSIQAYIEYLRNEVAIDKQKVEELTEEEKAKYAVIGTGLYIKGIEEKYKIEAPGEFWRTVADLKMTGNEVKEYIETFKENGITNMKDMSDYIKGEAPESGTRPSDVSSSIMDVLRKTYPELSENELAEKFNSLSL